MKQAKSAIATAGSSEETTDGPSRSLFESEMAWDNAGPA
jgi:hypothetical protein